MGKLAGTVCDAVSDGFIDVNAAADYDSGGVLTEICDTALLLDLLAARHSARAT